VAELHSTDDTAGARIDGAAAFAEGDDAEQGGEGLDVAEGLRVHRAGHEREEETDERSLHERKDDPTGMDAALLYHAAWSDAQGD